MRILSVYVAGFGKFARCKMDVSQDIVQIKQDNGWGKTTFVDFLECMFYGMYEGRKKNVAENFRVKYKPWHAEAFGGTLTFTAGGKTYRVERTFGKTPSFDTTKIYDENNNPVYLFGDKGEKLGETLFGVDRESYRRTVYMPQGEIVAEGFPQDLQGKLAALLTAGDGKSGKKDAILVLDEAERALRSKRAPKTGRLDVLDKELFDLQELQRRLEHAQSAAKELYAKAEGDKARFAQVMQSWRETDGKIAVYTARKERATQDVLRKEWETTLADAEARMQRLTEFFGQTPPESVNLQGLQTAIEEYYEIKQAAEGLQERIRLSDAAELETEKARIEWTAREKNAETYRSLLSAQKKERGKEEKADKKARKKAGKRGGYALVGVFLFLALLLFGLMRADTQSVWSYAAIGVGGLGAFACVCSFWKNTLAASARSGAAADKKLETEYKAALADALQAKNEYQTLCERQKENSLVKTEYEEKRARMQALEGAIRSFLSHFAVADYDYRAAADTIRKNAEEYVRQKETAQTYRRKLSDLPVAEDAPTFDEAEFANLQALRARLDEERNELQKSSATYYTKAENYMREGNGLSACREKIAAMQAEKTRLDNRLNAIRTARELIVRARENIAAQYLVPVENACKRYAAGLGFADGEKWRFNAAALPLAEENGVLKESEYYSAGMRGLWDLCIRLALTETLYKKELPVLLFDDVLRDFDDEKTEKGKQLLRELSKRYQIVYCTCKTERAL